MRNCVFIFIILTLAPFISYATEPIPYKDFISITNHVLDALDETEAIFAKSDVTKKEARESLTKLDAALKKYDRYQSGKWADGKQSEIVMNISMAVFEYKIFLATDGTDEGSRKDAIAFAGKARELFMIYKQKRK